MSEAYQHTQQSYEQSHELPSLEDGTAVFVADLKNMLVAVQRTNGQVEVMATTGLMENRIHHSFDAANRPIDDDYLVQVRSRMPVDIREDGVMLYDAKWVPDSTLREATQEELGQYLPEQQRRLVSPHSVELGHTAVSRLFHRSV